MNIFFKAVILFLVIFLLVNLFYFLLFTYQKIQNDRNCRYSLCGMIYPSYTEFADPYFLLDELFLSFCIFCLISIIWWIKILFGKK